MSRFKRPLIFIPVVVIAGLIVGGIRLKTFIDKQAYYESHDVKYGVPISGPHSEQVAMEKRAAFIRQAKVLRAKWEPYASEHRALLKRMRAASGSEAQVIQEINQEIHVDRADLGINAGDMYVTGAIPQFIYPRNQPKSRVPNFTWQLRKLPPSFPNSRLPQLKRQHDLPLSVSLGSSSYTRLTIWLSGRITESDFSAPVTKDNPRGESDPVEIVPAFHFLS